MAEERERTGKDVGSDSPASEEAAEQTKSGMEGAPRGSGEAGGANRQPPQSSGRSGRGPKARSRKGFEEGQAPSEQGEGRASPERVSKEQGLQGQKGRSGSRSAHGERGEDEATVHEK